MMMMILVTLKNLKKKRNKIQIIKKMMILGILKSPNMRKVNYLNQKRLLKRKIKIAALSSPSLDRLIKPLSFPFLMFLLALLHLFLCSYLRTLSSSHPSLLHTQRVNCSRNIERVRNKCQVQAISKTDFYLQLIQHIHHIIYLRIKQVLVKVTYHYI